MESYLKNKEKYKYYIIYKFIGEVNLIIICNFPKYIKRIKFVINNIIQFIIFI